MSSKKTAVASSKPAKPAGSAKAKPAKKTAVASSKPTKASKPAKPEMTAEEKQAKRAATYAAMRIVGLSIQALIDGKNTVDGIAKKVGCSVERVRRHTAWLNRGKTPVVSELKNGVIKPLTENISAGIRKSDVTAYQS